MFLLDIRYDSNNKTITKWIKDDDICTSIIEKYFPKIYISGNMADLQFFDKVPGIIDLHFEEKSTALGRRPEKVICATIDPNFIYDIKLVLDSNGYLLYNVNISTVRKYLLEKKLFPTARLKDDNIDDDQYALDYDIPLLSKDLSIIQKSKGFFTINDPIDKIYFGDSIIEGDEKDIIERLNSEIKLLDPDIILTNSGDSFELPYLYHRASLHNIRLQLGREKDIINGGSGRSYYSYGKMYYKPRGYYLSGRLHIDKSSFLFREGGLPGLIDISRIAGIPLQELSRLSPGSAVNVLHANQALRDNFLIKWTRNHPPQQPLTPDYGAIILEPKIGLHENIYELDFVSIFPNIMVNHNISPETVLCPCCPSDEKVPFIRYNICQKNIGLIPRVLRPLIDRRLEYKKRAKDDHLRSEEYEKKQKVIKWLLVTSFGYMGFNKAHFGSVECYESIIAYARYILLRTIELAENMEYDVLHGIVDCVWIKGPYPEKLCEIINKDIGIDIELKGLYNWIVFLPNKSDDSGSPFRYYGLMNNGKLKVRGIEMRQRGVPNIIRNLQSDILGKFTEAETASEFYSKIPETILILKDYTRKVINNECEFSDLIFEINVSRNIDEYKGFNNQVAAMRQLKDIGINILPGQSVRYIISDSRTKDYKKRIVLPELTDNNTKYDAKKYYKYLLKAAESILLPFGYTDIILDEIIDSDIQTKLCQYV
jgi:DNA polymerase elongation subunit (family B)